MKKFFILLTTWPFKFTRDSILVLGCFIFALSLSPPPAGIKTGVGCVAKWEAGRGGDLDILILDIVN